MSIIKAQDISIAPRGGFTGPGSGYLADTTNAPANFERLLSTIIGVMTIVAGIWFVFVFLTGAVGIIASSGDKGAYETARKKITTGITGLFIVVISIFLISLVGQLLGLDFLNVANWINTLSAS